MRSRGSLCCIGFSLLIAACSGDARQVEDPATKVIGTPALLSANGVVGVVAGSPISYDATKGGTAFSDPGGGGLRYTLALSGASGGLTTTGGTISGTPAVPNVVVATVTATDTRGNAASDRFAIVVFAAGLNAPTLPAALLHYTDASNALPADFTASVNGATVIATDNTPLTNPTTDAGATLGRVLFYDPRLSTNDVRPCSSCHIQSLGFTDALQFSVGFAGGKTMRHAPSLTNARFYKSGRFFWDERAATLEDQVLGPIQNPVEMGMALDTLVLKLRATSYYPSLFSAAFGTTDITSDRLARALAQYVRSLTSGKSKYDRAFDATGQANFASVFTAEEQRGEQLFRTSGCAQCHTTAAQVGDTPHNIGLDAADLDPGAGNGAMKAPSLRNVATRTRFMHDGRFTSLAQVIDFLDAGVQPNPNLDPLLKSADGTPRRLGLSGSDKSALIAFLGTLTDSSFLTDTRFSDPFFVASAPVPSSAALTIQGNAYHPSSVTVAPGATISFTNLDNRQHSASFFSSAIVSTPIFTSGTQTVKMPAAPGTYNFQCAIHGAAMSGSIVVQ